MKPVSQKPSPSASAAPASKKTSPIAPPAHDRRINFAEWIMAAATVVTGVFVGWQSMLLRESLSGPFSANLQERQIEVCATAIRAKAAVKSYAEMRHFVSSWSPQDDAHNDTDESSSSSEVEEVKPRTGSSFDADEMWSSNNFGFRSNNSSMADMRSSLAELRIYSSDETIEQIDALQDEFQAALALKGKSESSDAYFDAWLSALADKFTPIEEKCRDVMLGTKRGMI